MLSYENHYSLITQEPLLVCIILMIASRYYVLPGSGSATRATLIHQRLWEHCQHLIMRIIFGQEKKSKAKTRTIGAIEGLLLLVEWHPKAIHFPPRADGWDSDLLLSSADLRDDPSGNCADEVDGVASRWVREVVAPAQKSDRMSWMLLGTAQTLATELGLCEGHKTRTGSNLPRSDRMERGLRIVKLLHLLTELLSMRLGCVNMSPASLTRCLPGLSRDPKESAFLTGWIELTSLQRMMSNVLFPSANGTKELLSSFRYIDVIKHFRDQLAGWREKYLIDNSACSLRDQSS